MKRDEELQKRIEALRNAEYEAASRVHILKAILDLLGNAKRLSASVADVKESAALNYPAGDGPLRNTHRFEEALDHIEIVLMILYDIGGVE